MRGHEHLAALSYREDFERVGRSRHADTSPDYHHMMSFSPGASTGVAEQAAAAPVQIRQARSPSHWGAQGLSAGQALWARRWMAHQSAVGGAAGWQGCGAAVPSARRASCQWGVERLFASCQRNGAAVWPGDSTCSLARWTVARRAVHRIGGSVAGCGGVGRAAAWPGQFEEKSNYFLKN
jgi:hypothetical protein